MTSPPRAVVAASIAARAGRPGHALAFLAWAEGLRTLGYDVLVLDVLDDSTTVDEHGVTRDPVDLLRWSFDVADRLGLGGRYVVRWGGGANLIGATSAELESHLRTADVLLNVMGVLHDPELVGLPSIRLFVDVDPGFTQAWAEDGVDLTEGHEECATVGLTVGTPRCPVPTVGRRWWPTVPPVPLLWWPRAGGSPTTITSVGSWRGPYDALHRDGVRWGVRAHEFRRVVPLVERTGRRFELAIDAHPADQPELRELARRGWRLTDPRSLSDLDHYRRFVAESWAELCIPKEIHRVAQTGWFSDRSAAYLASGRPVIATATGFETVLPVGEGLFAPDGLDEFAEAVDELAADGERHAKAARALAEEHFAADVVVDRLLTRVGLR